ncbi:hypothetical protein G3I42_20510, partial [Streptomyces sp. SID11385]|nr:hypothetical protein [Streptomyces sp. SID11385]
MPARGFRRQHLRHRPLPAWLAHALHVPRVPVPRGAMVRGLLGALPLVLAVAA